jgi:hypothetical protein
MSMKYLFDNNSISDLYFSLPSSSLVMPAFKLCLDYRQAELEGRHSQRGRWERDHPLHLLMNLIFV